MTLEELQELMQDYDVFDNALLYHAYKDYMRDYEMIIASHIGPAPQGIYSYLFKYCVEVSIMTTLSDTNYKLSLDDRLLDSKTAQDIYGYVWGLKWSQIWEGWQLHKYSDKANAWSKRLGIPFFEVSIETNAMLITLLFSSLVVTQLSDKVSSGIDIGHISLVINQTKNENP